MQTIFKNFDEIFVNIFLSIKDEKLNVSKDIVLLNNVTVHNSSQSIVDDFTKLIIDRVAVGKGNGKRISSLPKGVENKAFPFPPCGKGN